MRFDRNELAGDFFCVSFCPLHGRMVENHVEGMRMWISDVSRSIWETLTKSTSRKMATGCLLCAIGIALLVDGCTQRYRWRIGDPGVINPRVPEVFLGTLVFIPGGILVVKGAKEYWGR